MFLATVVVAIPDVVPVSEVVHFIQYKVKVCQIAFILLPRERGVLILTLKRYLYINRSVLWPSWRLDISETKRSNLLKRVGHHRKIFLAA